MLLRQAAPIALALPLAIGLLAVPTISAPTGATIQEEELANLGDVRAEILAKADELAEMADKMKADIERDEIYRSILHYDTDHKDARKALGYSKSKGRWVFKKYKEPKNRAKDEDIAELHRQMKEAAELFEEKLEACFPTQSPTPQHKEGLRWEIEQMIGLDPNNEDLRERAGHKWDEDRKSWRLFEVVDAKLDRALREALMADLRANTPVGTRTDIDEGGAATGIPFSTVIESPRAKVATTGTPEEAQGTLALLHQAPDMLGHVFGIPDPFAQQGVQFRYYGLADPNLRLQFYQRHPEFQGDPEYQSTIDGSMFGNYCMCIASTRAQSRQDMATNNRVTTYLRQVFGADLESGWIWAGLGLYLSYQLCDTRLTLYIQRGEYGDSDGPQLGERLRDPEVDWLDEARLLLRQRGDREHNILTTLGRGVGDFTAEDLLCSYAISAYLFEGRRADLIEILKRIGKGDNPTLTFETVLGMPMDAFRERLVEWLAEVRKG